MSAVMLRQRLGFMLRSNLRVAAAVSSGCRLPSLLPQPFSASSTSLKRTYHSERSCVGDIFDAQRSQITLLDQKPLISRDTFIAPNAAVIGEVLLNDKSSIWYGSVIRGDINYIVVGAYTNVQDRTVITAADSVPTGFEACTTIGNYVTIGHGCLLRACTVEHFAMVGAGCIIMEGSIVQQYARLEPGSVVPPGRLIPTKQVWGGNPVRFIRNLDEEELPDAKFSAEKYYQLSLEHRDELIQPHTLLHYNAAQARRSAAAVQPPSHG